MGVMNQALWIPSERDLDVALVAKSHESLYDFVQIAWPRVVVEPYIDGRHVYEVCDHLQGVSEGHIESLVINVPPGSSKSTLCCILWPTWEWILRPEHKFIFASYSLENIRRDAWKAVALMNSQWFIERWGELLDNPKPAATMVKSAAGGFRKGTSVKGQVTGEHAKTRVVDDPIKPLDAMGGSQASPIKLEECIQWYDQTLGNRATDAKPRDVLIMQRLHENDLAAHVLEGKDVVHLKLPMRHVLSSTCKTYYKRTLPNGETVDKQGGDWRTKDGELLCPARWDDDACKARERRLGTAQAISAQEQQNPIPLGGNLVAKAWFRFWHPEGEGKTDPNGKPCLEAPTEKAGGFFYQSWDLSFGATDGASRVAGGVFLSQGPYNYLVDEEVYVRDFVTTCADMLSLSARWPQSVAKLVENKANGPALENSLKVEISGIELVNPDGSKVARFSSVIPIIKSGHYVLPHPELFPWVNEHIRELVGFPHHGYDDRVDMVSQALRWIQFGYMAQFNEAMKGPIS